MRAFIAIELDDTVKTALADVETRLKGALADVKWVERENLHLTIKFLGEVDEEKAGAIALALDSIGRTFPPFEISINGIGAFPQNEFPKVIWAGVGRNESIVKEIARAVENSAFALGIGKEERPFSAHLTIGRVKSAKNRTTLADRIATTLFSQEVRQTIHSITLFKSTLTSSGPIYTVIHRAALSALANCK